MARKIIDIECDSLDPTIIWCIVRIDVDTEEVEVWRHDEGSNLEWFGDDVYIGHNILAFDIPVVRSLHGIRSINTSNCIDTLVCSRLFNFQIDGPMPARCLPSSPPGRWRPAPPSPNC